MMRRCSLCGNNGHNSRTCPNRGVRLFGVRIADGSFRKSASMGNIAHYAGSGSGSGSGSPADSPPADQGAANGYASEDLPRGSRERKKGVPWTEEEHRMFLVGLQKLGKGDWRGISRNFVVTRTPTQVASHAQKYFIRQTNAGRRKRKCSLFDIGPDEIADGQFYPVESKEPETRSNNPPPAPPAQGGDCKPMDSDSNIGERAVLKPESLPCSYPVFFPPYFSPFFPIPFPSWSGYSAVNTSEMSHEIVKPTALHSKAPINVNELVGMSRLNLGESNGETGPSSSSLKLLGGSDRQSAFHAKAPTSGLMVDSSTSPVRAV
ncbi:transcription factor MYBS3 [Elaeis guineensis]|uniref:Transcription factor MYBS3 n=1 Tax=Elaeis guineensis var. tenera TaxID=51953 RepID=A0A6I9RZE1_ELAGV|nr:transcription factor MYBS3 [Elaeis guineensis]